MAGYTANLFRELAYNHPHMSEPEPTSHGHLPERTTERRTLKGRPTLVLLVLIGSCYALGYAIFRLLKGMHQ
jgi:hypothetical protein